MKDWFKARNIWGAAILSLSDAEAGRLAKALWSYTMSGEQQNLSGAEKGVFAMILMTLGQDEQASADISQKRALAGSTGGKQAQASASKRKQIEANTSNCFNKNKNKEEEEDIKENPLKGVKEKLRFSPPTLEDVTAYCRERGNRVDPQRFVDFYASKGWRVGNQPMKDWRAAVRTWEHDDRGHAAPQRVKTVSAQAYTQRQYTEDELAGDAVAALLAEARLKEGA